MKRLILNLSALVLGLLLGGASTFASAALHINLPYGACPAGSVMSNTGGTPSCGAIPTPSTVIDSVNVTAPRLDANGNPTSSPTPEIKSNIGAASSGSCVNVPSGWGTSGSGAACTITPPASAAVITGQFGTNASGNPIWCSAGNYCASSRLATCQTFAQNQNLAGGGYYGELNGTGSACNLYNNSSKTVFIYSTPVSPAVNCPTGYVQTGNAATNPSCVVTTNAALKLTIQKPVDGVCTIIRSGNAYSADPYDADCTGTGAPTVAPTKVSQSGTSGNSNVTINNDGSTTITNNTYNSNGTTNQTVINYGTDNKVTGSTSAVLQGTGDATGAPVPSTSPVTDVSGLATHSDVGAVGAAVTGAKDQAHADALATQGLLNPADTTAADKASGKGDGEADTADVTDRIVAASSEAAHDADEGLADQVGALIAGFIPSSVACSPWTGSVHGASFSFDWCPKIQLINEILGWLFALFTCFAIWQIAMRED